MISTYELARFVWNGLPGEDTASLQEFVGEGPDEISCHCGDRDDIELVPRSLYQRFVQTSQKQNKLRRLQKYMIANEENKGS